MKIENVFVSKYMREFWIVKIYRAFNFLEVKKSKS